jgi:hypothetical protein
MLNPQPDEQVLDVGCGLCGGYTAPANSLCRLPPLLLAGRPAAAVRPFCR